LQLGPVSVAAATQWCSMFTRTGLVLGDLALSRKIESQYRAHQVGGKGRPARRYCQFPGQIIFLSLSLSLALCVCVLLFSIKHLCYLLLQTHFCPPLKIARRDVKWPDLSAPEREKEKTLTCTPKSLLSTIRRSILQKRHIPFFLSLSL
jgi:hypothetical protein